ncbi:MAG: binding-protein-dependent transport system inner rane component [Acidimicrobiales bacterium]|jgi:NitT/TauT family transport system permease protein|nr:binding-protein-dependent transport system inner rane component [Acidimicrobiales bacterium]
MATRERQGRLEARGDRLAAELSGLDALELHDEATAGRLRRIWTAAWPKLAAVGLALGIWQLVVMSGWRPEFVLPSPFTTLDRLWEDMGTAELWQAIGTTMRRAAVGFALAVVIGGVVGAAVSRSRILRSAVGSLITGLQTMPSIAWFPLAVLLFKRTEAAILFVIVLGAAPSVANGLISGIDQVPPLLLRAGRVLGARGLSAWRHVVLPAALPNVVAGLKQGWAFAWRSLLAGELLVTIANKSSIGVDLDTARQLSDAPRVLAVMIVILVIGVLVDSLFFGTVERSLARRRGLAQH